MQLERRYTGGALAGLSCSSPSNNSGPSRRDDVNAVDDKPPSGAAISVGPREGEKSVPPDYETAVVSGLDVRAATRLSDLRQIFRKIGFSKTEAERLASVAWKLLKEMQGQPGIPAIEDSKNYSDLADRLRAVTATLRETK